MKTLFPVTSPQPPGGTHPPEPIAGALGRPGGHGEGPNTRSHPELGRENPLRRWYCTSRCGRVGRRQARQAPLSPSSSPPNQADAMGSQAYVLAIDQGTTSTRAILFDTTGRARAIAQSELTQHHPRPGWVEHDPEEIWRSVLLTGREVIAAADGPITALGIANQRETTVLWERATGRPIHNAIVWQDRRTADICEQWR